MAKRTEVLLVKDVLKLGNMGDIVRVAPGYARNYLYPYGLAVQAGGAAKRQIEVLREKAAKNETEREAKAQTQAKTMVGLTVQVAARVAQDDELFGSIGTKEIVAALAKAGVKVDGKQVHLVDKLKKLGRYQLEIRLHKNVPVTITVEVVNSDPNAPSLAETLALVAAKKAEKAAKKTTGAEGAPAEGEAKAEEKPADDKKADEKKADKKDKKSDKKADEKKSDDKKTDDKKTDDKKTDKKAAGGKKKG